MQIVQCAVTTAFGCPAPWSPPDQVASSAQSATPFAWRIRVGICAVSQGEFSVCKERLFLVGRLVHLAVPNRRYNPAGRSKHPAQKFSVATDDSYKGNCNGERQKRHRGDKIVVWGKRPDEKLHRRRYMSVCKKGLR